MPITEERIDRIERAVQDFIVSVNESHMRTEAELREFKDDVKESHMPTEAERREFKDEMRNYKEENRQQIREMNIKWGEMAKKLGTITGDLVAPSIPRGLNRKSGKTITDFINIYPSLYNN